MIVGYARVSTRDQDLAVQIDQLVVAGCEKVFREKRSGTTTEGRAALEEALEFVRDGDVLLVARLDRLARSLSDLLQIVERLQRKGVGFRAVNQPTIDTTRPEGKLMLSMLGAFAEFETGLRKERQLEGIERAKGEGRYTGGKRKIDPEEARRMRRDEKLGAAEIGRRLGCNARTVYRATPGMWDEAPETLRRA